MGKQDFKLHKSILRYPGGKIRLTPFIVESLQLNHNKCDVFAEPFCGGASIAINMLENKLAQKIAINDFDPLVASLWRCVFHPDDAQWLAQVIQTIPITLEEWDTQRAIESSDTRTLALKCLFLNRTTFNGILHRNAGPIGGRAQKNRTLDVRFNRNFLSQRILALSKWHESVKVYNLPWIDFCKQTHKNHKSPFFYLDPPYYFKAAKLYHHTFDHEQHCALRDYLSELKAPWLLSYDDAEEVRKLYKGLPLRSRIIDKTYSTHPIGGGFVYWQRSDFFQPQTSPKTNGTFNTASRGDS